MLGYCFANTDLHYHVYVGFFSVTIVEGTVQNLIEDNGVVIGVKYATKRSDDTQVCGG